MRDCDGRRSGALPGQRLVLVRYRTDDRGQRRGDHVVAIGSPPILQRTLENLIEFALSNETEGESQSVIFEGGI